MNRINYPFRDYNMTTLNEVRTILGHTLQLGSRAESLAPGSGLLGSIPELDSMAVVNLIAALENHFGFTVNDDEISAETFATLASLTEFVENKLQDS